MNTTARSYAPTLLPASKSVGWSWDRKSRLKFTPNQLETPLPKGPLSDPAEASKARRCRDSRSNWVKSLRKGLKELTGRDFESLPSARGSALSEFDIER